VSICASRMWFLVFFLLTHMMLKSHYWYLISSLVWIGYINIELLIICFLAKQQGIPMVQDSLDVFLYKLPRMAPKHERTKLFFKKLIYNLAENFGVIKKFGDVAPTLEFQSQWKAILNNQLLLGVNWSINSGCDLHESRL
ncbi:hypothetical protein ACJX0J_009427, partial [Zea mays]